MSNRLILIALLAAFALFVVACEAESTEGTEILVGVDMDPAGNGCPGDGTHDCTTGTIDECRSVPATEGTTFQIDTVVTGLWEGYGGFNHDLSFPDAASGSRLTMTAQVQNDPLVNLIVQSAGSSFVSLSQAVPDTTSPHTGAVTDFGTNETTPPWTQGVLARYTFQVGSGATPGVNAMALANASVLDIKGGEYSDKVTTDGVLALGTPCDRERGQTASPTATPATAGATSTATPAATAKPTSTPQPDSCPTPIRGEDFAGTPVAVPVEEIPGQRIEGGGVYREAYVTLDLPPGREFIIFGWWSPEDSRVHIDFFDTQTRSTLVLRGDGCEMARSVRDPAADAIFDEMMSRLEIGSTYTCPTAVREVISPESAETSRPIVEGGGPVQLGPMTLHLPVGRQFTLGKAPPIDPGGTYYWVYDIESRSEMLLRGDGCEVHRQVSDPTADAVFDEIVAGLEAPSR